MKKIIFLMGCCIALILIFGSDNISIGESNDQQCRQSANINKQSFSGLRNIMVTGFWDPTGQMISHFSTDHYLNPTGWRGENWKDFGYNVYSFFPAPETYNGTFEVDYQDTWNDFWNITADIKPIAIISFGAGLGPWEIEYNARNLDEWIDDEKEPYQPTPCPPDDSVPVDFERHSSLPVQNIADAVNNKTTIRAWIDWSGDPGEYLCEYIAYLGMWYQSMHSGLDDPFPCRAAGFVHVKSRVPLASATEAANITIEETIKYLIEINTRPNNPEISGPREGKVGEEYEYAFTSTDSEGDAIFYYIDWGDNSSDEWMGPYNSGEIVKINNTWDSRGAFTIKAKAKDATGAESDWGILEVSMPYKHQTLWEIIIEWILQLFGVS